MAGPRKAAVKSAISSNWTARFKNFSCLLLDDHGPAPDLPARNQRTDLQFHAVAAAKLAIDGEIEQRALSKPRFTIKEEAKLPDLLRFQGALRADLLSRVPSGRRIDDRIEF
jgi:hypothetical protein